MDKAEMQIIIAGELQTEMPGGLSALEQGTWRMLYNALRENDLSKKEESGKKVIALRATIDTVFSADCGKRDVVVSTDNTIVTVYCTEPKIEIEAFVKGKASLFKPWSVFVTAKQASPNEKITLLVYTVTFT
jgi:hypothetical protein